MPDSKEEVGEGGADGRLEWGRNLKNCALSRLGVHSYVTAVTTESPWFPHA